MEDDDSVASADINIELFPLSSINWDRPSYDIEEARTG